MEYIWHYDSPLGGMTMVSDGQALAALQFNCPGPSGDGPDGLDTKRRLLQLEQIIK